MDNRVYYGQYSLKHWLDLILKQNILLPDYQRYFVWAEKKVKTLVETFKKKQFVPPITIGAFRKDDGSNQNLILDGQQRLTSVLLAYLGLFPDPATFKSTLENRASDNDDVIDPEDEMDTILNWDFNKLTEKGKNKLEILSKIKAGKYKVVDFGINEDFLNNTFLGFSYLVPHTQDQSQQQKYYSSVFRNINIQGESLLPQESRASLYFLNKDLAGFFDPNFSQTLTIKNFSSENTADFVRFLALLSQYAKYSSSVNIARGFRYQMENYYEQYIYSVVGEASSTLFKPFAEIFPDGNYQTSFQRLEQTLIDLNIPKQFTSIIETDMYLFGCIYNVVFEKKSIDVTKGAELREEIDSQIAAFKTDEGHKKTPNALKYLKARIDASIGIYKKYLNEEA
jgi:uncharacterized protein with ParB-like and HNH nuclease domain